MVNDGSEEEKKKSMIGSATVLFTAAQGRCFRLM